MEIPIVNTVPANVLRMPDEKSVMSMDIDYHERLVAYRTTMSLVEDMLSEGIITTQDYEIIDEMIANLKGLSLSSICCREPLIMSKNRGNIQYTKGGDQYG